MSEQSTSPGEKELLNCPLSLPLLSSASLSLSPTPFLLAERTGTGNSHSLATTEAPFTICAGPPLMANPECVWMGVCVCVCVQKSKARPEEGRCGVLVW